ncbi:MAG TPA: Hpt domain-containing protein [Bryobacteraceae bacterium]|jgi:HPt (histidine-containing phosphotransfer) domain-containing protein/CheY-like chemotaxis protein|nr:Hpt domain-containing protein [Bryobacteraceae bacterium]
MRMRCEEEAAGIPEAGTLRILIVGAGSTRKVSGQLTRVGHSVVAAADLVEATEALILERFAAVLLTAEIAAADVEEFTAAVHELDRRAGAQTRTPVLLIVPEGSTEGDLQPLLRSAIDGVVAESTDADALTLAIARLAAAVSVDKGIATAALAPELPVLRVEELQEQVAYDNDLLVELIDLYIGERAKQSTEMKSALARGQWERLSRVVHTIKGSLGSLHAEAAHATAQALEMAARDEDAVLCADFLSLFETQLDTLEELLLALRRRLRGY